MRDKVSGSKQVSDLKRMAVATALCLALGGVCAPTAARAETSQQALDNAQSEYEDTAREKESVSNELESLTADRNSLEGVLDDLTVDMDEAAGILEELETKITSTQEQIDMTWGHIETLSVNIEELEVRAEEEYDRAKAQIKFAYETGPDMRAVMLTGVGSYADYLNRAIYMQMFTGYYQETIDALISTSKTLGETKEEYERSLMDLEQSKQELEEYQETVRTQYDEISARIDEAGRQIKAYDDQIDAAEERIREYEEELDRQESNIETLKARIEEEKQMSAKADAAGWRDISTISASDSDRKLLANLIWCEAGSEPYVGQVAVGAVVMNRVMSSVFPDTITGVIYQGRQFTPAHSGRLALALARDSADESCYRAADAALSGVNNIGSCLYFRTPVSSISAKYTIGGHIFY